MDSAWSDMGVFTKDVLSEPVSIADNRVLNTVILIVSLFSAIGAGWIVVNFLVSSFPLQNRGHCPYDIRRSDPYGPSDTNLSCENTPLMIPVCTVR